MSFINENVETPACKTSAYMKLIENRIIINQDTPLNPKKIIITNDAMEIPCYNNIDILFKYNYNLQQLKLFAKHHKIKTTGTKKQLLTNIYNFLYLSKFVIKIQKLFRGFLLRQYNKLRGPALLKRGLCNNNNDFLTFENLQDIENKQFFSYNDKDNFIYGFDLLSIYNLIFTKKGNSYILNKEIKNPYNRNDISPDVINNIKKLLRISKLIKNDIVVKIKDINEDISYQKSLELKALELFQYINSLGNYSDVNWFLSLDKHKLIRFIKELNDIWNYRAQIFQSVKRAICPPNGNPFTNVSNLMYMNNSRNIYEIRKNILDILEKFIMSGIDRENRKLGSLYVLSALTLVSENAATSIPWLFDSVSNNWANIDDDEIS